MERKEGEEGGPSASDSVDAGCARWVPQVSA
jgi:hypothetical protein